MREDSGNFVIKHVAFLLSEERKYLIAPKGKRTHNYLVYTTTTLCLSYLFLNQLHKEGGSRFS